MRNHTQTQAELAYHRSQLTSALETAQTFLDNAANGMKQLRSLEPTLTTRDVIERLATLEGQRLALLHELRYAASHAAHIERLSKQKELPIPQPEEDSMKGGGQ